MMYEIEFLIPKEKISEFYILFFFKTPKTLKINILWGILDVNITRTYTLKFFVTIFSFKFLR